MAWGSGARGARTDERQRRRLDASQGVLAVTGAQTAAYAANYGDQVVMDTTAAALTVTLPTAFGCRDQTIGIKNRGSASHAVTVTPAAGETIDGATSRAVTDGENVILQSDGENWIIV